MPDSDSARPVVRSAIVIAGTLLVLGVLLVSTLPRHTPELRTLSYRASLHLTRSLGGGNVLTGHASEGATGRAVFVARPAPPEAPELSRRAGHALRFSTYLGGGGYDLGAAVAIDAHGYVYVAGSTTSSDFPTRNAAQSYTGGLIGFDIYVAKFSARGDTLIYATYLGGSGDELLTALAVDAEGRAYVAGGTASPDFPAPNALYGYKGGGRLFSDAFVARLSADGSHVDFATYLGGSGDDTATALTLDEDGSIYLAGTTISDDLPTTPGAFQAVRPDTSEGRTDVFVARLAPRGDSFDLAYATYLGGGGDEAPTRLAAEGGGVWITGFTNSVDFPVRNPLQDGFAGPFRDGEGDAFVARINGDGSSLDYSTYLGGKHDDQGTGVAVDETGNVYVTGSTMSSDFPTTPGAFQPQRIGLRNRFVVRLTPAAGGWTLDQSTFLGSTGVDLGTAGLGIDREGQVWIAGSTNSDGLPMVDPSQSTYGGGAFDGFLARLDAGGAGLGFSTFLGGAESEVVTGLAVGDSTVCVTGSTGSADFPTRRAVQAAFDGPPSSGQDVSSSFVACFDLAATAGVSVEATDDVPEKFALHANYPNPFNPRTVIPFDVKEPTRVVLAVYDVLGRRIATLADDEYSPGRHEVHFDGGEVASGAYFYVIEMGHRGRLFRDVKKMVLVR